MVVILVGRLKDFDLSFGVDAYKNYKVITF